MQARIDVPGCAAGVRWRRAIPARRCPACDLYRARGEGDKRGVLHIHESDTGQFVVVDPDRDVVVVHPDVNAAVARARELCAAVERPGPLRPGAPPRRRYGTWLLLAGIPLLWTAAAYLSLSDLVADFAGERATAEDRDRRLDELGREVEGLRSLVEDLQREAARTRRRPKDEKRPAAAPEDALEEEAEGLDPVKADPVEVAPAKEVPVATEKKPAAKSRPSEVKQPE